MKCYPKKSGKEYSSRIVFSVRVGYYIIITIQVKRKKIHLSKLISLSVKHVRPNCVSIHNKRLELMGYFPSPMDKSRWQEIFDN